MLWVGIAIDQHKPTDQNASYHACQKGFHVLRELVFRDAPHLPSSRIFTRMKGCRNHHRCLTESEDLSNSNNDGCIRKSSLFLNHTKTTCSNGKSNTTNTHRGLFIKLVGKVLRASFTSSLNYK